MAGSQSHKWGQILGYLVEQAVEPLLAEFAQVHQLYLDKKGTRPARTTKEVIWKDYRGNNHKLDYVLERDGTDTQIGVPVAFIEIAWRRYTKHSKNKAQEIEAAIQPLVTTYKGSVAFFGVIIGGQFTQPAITQLETTGFNVLYLPYATIVEAFAAVGIDISSEEITEEAIFAQKVAAISALPASQHSIIFTKLFAINADTMNHFMETLRSAISRRIDTISITPLYGKTHDFRSIADSLTFMSAFDDGKRVEQFKKIEIRLQYNNGSHIDGVFFDAWSAAQFLQEYQPLRPIQTNAANEVTTVQAVLDEDDG